MTSRRALTGRREKKGEEPQKETRVLAVLYDLNSRRHPILVSAPRTAEAGAVEDWRRDCDESEEE